MEITCKIPEADLRKMIEHKLSENLNGSNIQIDSIKINYYNNPVELKEDAIVSAHVVLSPTPEQKDNNLEHGVTRTVNIEDNYYSPEYIEQLKAAIDKSVHFGSVLEVAYQSHDGNWFIGKILRKINDNIVTIATKGIISSEEFNLNEGKCRLIDGRKVKDPFHQNEIVTLMTYYGDKAYLLDKDEKMMIIPIDKCNIITE